MKRYPKLAEHITVSTWPYSFKGFYGYRNFTIKAVSYTHLGVQHRGLQIWDLQILQDQHASIW